MESNKKVDDIFNKKNNINDLLKGNNNLFADENNDKNEENIRVEDDKAFNDLFNSKNVANKNTLGNN